ncbi:unnamed protein product [Timema podura]|uniref:Cytochrome c oxidase subunit n=1 Tax=Timema podura TaxID=61482 RepID=A0ABN7NSH1_TIMPD|nr:unnamed protein product [Timema podura]
MSGFKPCLAVVASTAPISLSVTLLSLAKASTAKKWKFIFFLVCLPVVGAASFNAYWLTTTTKFERPKFIKYEHLRIRNKRFPWGDGDKTFFHNPKVNALSDGYEEDEHEELKKPKPPRRADI